MTAAEILALLQAVPGIYAAASNFITNASDTDIAQLNGAIAVAKAAALTDEAQALVDLRGAGA